MKFDFLDASEANSLIGIFLKKLLDKILYFIWDKRGFWKYQVMLDYVFKSDIFALSFERSLSIEELKQHYTKAPEVGRIRHILS